ncbi:GerMN domain-containing protein [Trichothermofontia sp.]
MQDQRIPKTRRMPPPGILVSLSTLLLLTTGVTAWWTWRSFNPSQTPPLPIPEEEVSSVTPPKVTAPAEQTLAVYWLRDTGTHLEVVPSPVGIAKSLKGEAALAAAFNQLLAGPQAQTAGMVSTIPTGTQLLDLKVAPDGVHVDLSPEFTTGGGSSSMSGRLAQVLYTATTLDPNANVWLTIAGKPLEVLGGEGIMVDQPMTRVAFEENYDL